jgi:arsenite-transporting ATPase
LFVGGKGGVGKTTCAAMFAASPPHHARRARPPRTLLVTTDPASSLSAVLGIRVGAAPTAVRGAAGLFAANIDSASAFERWLAPRRELLAAIALRGTYLDEEDVARLLKLSLPGIDEVIGLVEAMRLAEGFDRVVVDTAPTGHTLRLLAAPVLLGRVAGILDSLQAHHRAVVSALRGSYRTDAADAFIVALQQEGDALVSMLRDPAVNEVTWVTLPEPMALEETADAIDALESAGIHVDRLIVNRLTPASPKPRRGEGGPQSCAFCEARRRFESRALAPVSHRFAGREILSLPQVDAEPVGIAALRRLHGRLAPWIPSEVEPPIAHRVRALLQPPPAERRPDQAARGLRRAPGSHPLDTDLAGDARWILFGGKGGVGKSTCAAALALRLARDRPVLLLSTDPAHSLGDVFGVRLDNEPRAIAGAPAALRVREIDARAEMDRFRRKYVDAVDEAFSRIARAAGGDQAAFRELIDLAPPGIDEVIAIADVAAAVTGERDDGVIVTDTAPTGHALRLLQTPAVLREWTQALMAILLKYREIVGAGTLAALLVQLSKRLRGLNDALRDRTQTRFNVVTRAAALPLAESASLIEALASLQIPVGALVVNAVGAGTCGRCRSSAAAEGKAIARLRAAAHAYAIIEAPAEVPPPHGAAALVEWGCAWRRLT